MDNRETIYKDEAIRIFCNIDCGAAPCPEGHGCTAIETIRRMPDANSFAQLTDHIHETFAELGKDMRRASADMVLAIRKNLNESRPYGREEADRIDRIHKTEPQAEGSE